MSAITSTISLVKTLQVVPPKPMHLYSNKHITKKEKQCKVGHIQNTNRWLRNKTCSGNQPNKQAHEHSNHANKENGATKNPSYQLQPHIISTLSVGDVLLGGRERTRFRNTTNF